MHIVTACGRFNPFIENYIIIGKHGVKNTSLPLFFVRQSLSKSVTMLTSLSEKSVKILTPYSSLLKGVQAHFYHQGLKYISYIMSEYLHVNQLGLQQAFYV